MSTFCDTGYSHVISFQNAKYYFCVIVVVFRIYRVYIYRGVM